MSRFLGPNQRLRLIGVGLLTATFVAGGIAGIAAWRTVDVDAPSTAAGRSDAEEPCPPKPDPYGGLGLTAAQRTEIDAIVAEGRVSIDAFWDRYGAELRAIRDTTRERINQVLTSEQRVVLERRREERHRHRDCDRDRDGNGKKD